MLSRRNRCGIARGSGSYETLLRKEIENRKDHDSSDEIINNLLRLGESIGDVMEETRKALDDDKVDEKEKEQISVEVIELEKKIAELKLCLLYTSPSPRD